MEGSRHGRDKSHFVRAQRRGGLTKQVLTSDRSLDLAEKFLERLGGQLRMDDPAEQSSDCRNALRRSVLMGQLVTRSWDNLSRRPAIDAYGMSSCRMEVTPRLEGSHADLGERRRLRIGRESFPRPPSAPRTAPTAFMPKKRRLRGQQPARGAVECRAEIPGHKPTRLCLSLPSRSGRGVFPGHAETVGEDSERRQ